MESSSHSRSINLSFAAPQSDEPEDRLFRLQDLEEIRARIDARIQEAQLTVVNSEAEVTPADETLIVR